MGVRDWMRIVGWQGIAFNHNMNICNCNDPQHCGQTCKFTVRTVWVNFVGESVRNACVCEGLRGQLDTHVSTLLYILSHCHFAEIATNSLWNSVMRA